MNGDQFNFTTGSTFLPDSGVCDYNGCTFSPLFVSTVQSNCVADEAGRAVKFVEVTITLDGYVTQGQNLLFDIDSTMQTLHRLLTAQGGSLRYEGRGFNIVVNRRGGGGGVAVAARPAGGVAVAGFRVGDDVAWGPVPKLIEFQPLGDGQSAKVRWTVTTRFSTIPAGKGFKGDGVTLPLLQFNFESSVSYNEDYYSRLSTRGTLEVPMTRTPTQDTRTVPYTADAMRPIVQERVLRGIDLSRFRITGREFNVSRDKRTLTWDVTAEEKPWMDLPPGCPVARGTYTVKPAKAGAGLGLWLCNLSATYTVRKGMSRRQAWTLFLGLMRLRMSASELGNIPDLPNGDKQNSDEKRLRAERDRLVRDIKRFTPVLPFPGAPPIAQLVGEGGPNKTPRKAILVDFQVREGVYLDSKTVTFSATWRLTTTFTHILLASGLWSKMAEQDAAGNNLWAISMSDVSGDVSWLTNRLDPGLDVVVDFGSTG